MVVTRRISLTGSALDATLALLLTAAVLTETLLSAHARGPVALNVLDVIVFAAPAAFARRRPVLAIAVIVVAATVQAVWLTPLDDLVTPFAVLLLAAYRLGAHASRAALLIGCVLSAVGVAASGLLAPAAVRHEGSFAPVAGLLAGTIIAGRVSRRGLARAVGLDAEMREAEDRLELTERRAIAAEQARISRELHDELAHALTAVVLQAGAAQRVWSADPDAAAAAVSAMAKVSRAALTHLRSTLAVLGPGAPAGRGLDDLARLVDLAGQSGLEVALRLDTADGLGGPAEQVAFRVVQEALTNAARHAAPARVELTVQQRSGELVIRVRNDPPPPLTRPSAALPAGAGTGLRGLRHRVESLGGTLSAGPCADGGFLVEALVPVGTGG